MKKRKIINLIITSILFFNTLTAQIDVLQSIGIDPNIIDSDGFTIIEEKEDRLKIEKELSSIFFNRVVITFREKSTVIDLYNTNSTKEQLKELSEIYYQKYGKDSDGKKAYGSKELIMYEHGVVEHRVWTISKKVTSMLNYSNKVQITKDYNGIVNSIYMKDKLYDISDIKSRIEAEKVGLEKPLTFRQTYWGMYKEQVIALEGTPVVNEKDILLYDDQQIANQFDVQIGYVFVNNKLVRSKYLLANEHTNDNKYIEDFLNVTELLEKKYGNAIEKEKLWSNDLYKNNIDNYGMAVSVGHLTIYYKWRTKDTDIIAKISGDNYSIVNQIEYKSRLLESVEKKENEKKVLSDF